jgi:hypothetical protein
VAIDSADQEAISPSGWSSTNAVKLLTGGQGRPAAIVASILVALLYGLLGQRYWRPVQHTVFDAYQRAFPRQVTRPPVIIIDIDEASLQALGQWPWPRTRLARLIEATHRMGALAVGLDMIMPEADRLSPSVFVAERPDVSQALREELAQLPSNDAILADILRNTPSVVGRAGTFAPRGDTAGGQTPVRVYGDTPITHVQVYAGHMTNLPAIERAAAGHGYLNATLDADGVVRTMPLLVAVHRALAPTLAIELVRVAVGESWYGVYGSRGGVRGVQIGKAFIPTDSDGRIRLQAKLQPHHGDSYGYRFEMNDKVVVYSTDGEHELASEDETDAMVEFYQNADLVIFDAMYSMANMVSVKDDWGHSSNIVGVDLWLRANVKHYCMFHHQPTYDDSTIDNVLLETRRYEEIVQEGASLQVSSAYDGLVLEV